MSVNEVVIAVALFAIGAITGAFFAYRSAARGGDLRSAMLRSLVISILIPLGLLFVMGMIEVSTEFSGISDPAKASIGLSVFYAIGASIISVPSALIACWLVYRSESLS